MTWVIRGNHDVIHIWRNLRHLFQAQQRRELLERKTFTEESGILDPQSRYSNYAPRQPDTHEIYRHAFLRYICPQTLILSMKSNFSLFFFIQLPAHAASSSFFYHHLLKMKELPSPGKTIYSLCSDLEIVAAAAA